MEEGERSWIRLQLCYPRLSKRGWDINNAGVNNMGAGSNFMFWYSAVYFFTQTFMREISYVMVIILRSWGFAGNITGPILFLPVGLKREINNWFMFPYNGLQFLCVSQQRSCLVACETFVWMDNISSNTKVNCPVIVSRTILIPCSLISIP